MKSNASSNAIIPRVWWIPVYNDLLRHRNLLRIKHELKVHRVYAMGMVAAAYLWLANEITEKHQDGLDAVLELEDAPIVIDGEVDFAGFFEAMCKVGWFVWDKDHASLRVVRYFEKNGAQALKRAREQNRKVHVRRRGEEPSGEEPGVTTMDDGERTRSGHGADTERTRSGHGADTRRTQGGHKADAGRTQGGHGADQQEQEEEENNQPTNPGTSVRSDAVVQPHELVGWLVEQGIRKEVAEKLAESTPAPVLLTAGKMALLAEQQGFKGNRAGFIIKRVNDGTAAAAVKSKQVGDDEIAGREWARMFLDNDAAAQQAVFDSLVSRDPSWKRVGMKAVLSVLPAEAMLALGAVLAERVERGDMNGRDVPAAFSSLVMRLGGGA